MQEEEVAALRREAKKREGRAWEADAEALRNDIEGLQSLVKRVEKRSGEVAREMRSGTGGEWGEKLEKMEEQLELSQLKNKQYIDRAVGELKTLIKEYVREQAELEQKVEQRAEQRAEQRVSQNAPQLTSSRSRLAQPRSSKSIRASQEHETSLEERQKCRSPQNGSSSRVSYLKEKLKEFEEINKKYEDKADRKKDDGKTVQKMKEFRNYLEQSESEIEHSNLDIPALHSSSKWTPEPRYH
jgi:DNA repair exonuclease SbcCD ATPase subunit